MGLMLHIFQKDIRRLWWECAVSLALLAALAHFDAHRTDALCSSREGMLNRCCLSIQEDSPVGDRQFWIARPYPWRALVGAKAAFAIAFIHLPSLAADVAIVTTQGFRPSEYIAALAWKQIPLAAALAVPAAALAALPRNLAQFVLAVVLIIGLGIILMIGADERYSRGMSESHPRPGRAHPPASP